MGGIVFLRTTDLEGITRFYRGLGCTVWLRQPAIQILRFGNLLLGFHQTEGEADTEGLITFFYGTREEVDEAFGRFRDIADGPPRYNDRYGIYQFFAADPEGRKLEFQWFDHELPAFGG